MNFRPMAVIAHKDPSLPAPPPLPDGAGWTAALARLEPGAAEALVVLVRTLYPHDWLPDRVYRRVVTAYDRLAAASPAAEALIAQTLTRLDDGAGPPFAERSESYRLAALRAIEGTPGFVLLQRAAVRFLYDDIEVWSALGYEGASTHLGGYVDRGFDDPDWLEAAPGEA